MLLGMTSLYEVLTVRGMRPQRKQTPNCQYRYTFSPFIQYLKLSHGWGRPIDMGLPPAWCDVKAPLSDIRGYCREGLSHSFLLKRFSSTYSKRQETEEETGKSWLGASSVRKETRNSLHCNFLHLPYCLQQKIYTCLFFVLLLCPGK